MSGFETRFAADQDAERIRAAFYGFVERHAEEVEGPAHIWTEIDGAASRLTVRLWSAEAMSTFLSHLEAREPRRP